jgi:hypothetical protein
MPSIRFRLRTMMIVIAILAVLMAVRQALAPYDFVWSMRLEGSYVVITITQPSKIPSVRPRAARVRLHNMYREIPGTEPRLAFVLAHSSPYKVPIVNVVADVAALIASLALVITYWATGRRVSLCTAHPSRRTEPGRSGETNSVGADSRARHVLENLR